MKGLLYKEWCIGKKNCSLFLIMSLVFCLLGILVFLSMICGNLKSWPSEQPESVKVFTYIFCYVPYILMLMAATSVNQTIFTDYDSGWLKYSYTLPKKALNVIGAKYIYSGIILAIATIYGLFNAGIICIMAKEAFTIELLKNFIVILLFGICEVAVVIPASLLLKNARTVTTVGAVFCMAAYIAGGYILVQFDNKYHEDAPRMIKKLLLNIRDAAFVFSLLIAVVLIVISIFVSCKIYQRREK